MGSMFDALGITKLQLSLGVASLLVLIIVISAVLIKFRIPAFIAISASIVVVLVIPALLLLLGVA